MERITAAFEIPNPTAWGEQRAASSLKLTGMSSIPKSDYIKVLLLLTLLSICSYSALQKFVFVDTSSNRALQVDYTVCEKYDTGGDKADTELLSSCKNIVSVAYEEAEQKCKGYIQKLSSCMQNRKSRCRNEHTNVDGCVNAIVASKIEKWTASSWINGLRNDQPGSRRSIGICFNFCPSILLWPLPVSAVLWYTYETQTWWTLLSTTAAVSRSSMKLLRMEGKGRSYRDGLLFF